MESKACKRCGVIENQFGNNQTEILFVSFIPGRKSEPLCGDCNDLWTVEHTTSGPALRFMEMHQRLIAFRQVGFVPFSGEMTVKEFSVFISTYAVRTQAFVKYINKWLEG